MLASFLARAKTFTISNLAKNIAKLDVSKLFPESGREGFFREKRCHQTSSSNIAQSSAEVMAVFKDCHQRLPKVLLK